MRTGNTGGQATRVSESAGACAAHTFAYKPFKGCRPHSSSLFTSPGTLTLVLRVVRVKPPLGARVLHSLPELTGAAANNGGWPLSQGTGCWGASFADASNITCRQAPTLVSARRAERACCVIANAAVVPGAA